MSEGPKPDFPYYRSPTSIRNEVFSHRVRGLDEDEVREYLELLADQVQSLENDWQDAVAECKRLRAENERQRVEPQREAEELSRQAAALFSEAQQVADQLVEEAVRHARELMTDARHQQRQILEEAHRAAAAVAGDAQRVGGQQGDILSARTDRSPEDAERVRSAVEAVQAAQLRLRELADALTEQADQLDGVHRGAGRASRTDATGGGPWLGP